jgi:TM2 domain-containing membrane protein YozV
MPFCRICGVQYTEGARFCSNCGAALEAPPATYHVTRSLGEVTVSRLPRKNTGVAALLAALGGIILLGIGHFYVGKIGRGVVLLVVGLVLKILLVALPVFLIPISLLSILFSPVPPTGTIGLALLILILLSASNLGLWIWQIYDAYALANLYNELVERTGKVPW